MDANLVNTPSSQAIVMDNSGINSVSSVAPSPVILLPSNLMSPMILPNQQPDILQQALEAAMPNSSNASSGNVTKLPTIPIQPGAKTKEDFVTVFRFSRTTNTNICLTAYQCTQKKNSKEICLWCPTMNSVRKLHTKFEFKRLYCQFLLKSLMINQKHKH